MRWWPSVCAGIAVLSLAGCGEFVTDDSFTGRTYVGESVEASGAPVDLVPGSRLTLSFAEDQISASAGCNLFSGTGGIQDGRLVIDELAGTEMACEPDLMAQEAWWAELLASEPQAQVGDRSLTLTGADRTVSMIAQETIADLPLTGTLWSLDTVVMHDAASSVPAGSSSTLFIGADDAAEADSSGDESADLDTSDTGPSDPDTSDIGTSEPGTSELGPSNTGTADVESLRIVVDDCRDTSTAVEIGATSLVLDGSSFAGSTCRDDSEVIDRAVRAVFGAGDVPYVVEGDVLRLTGPFGWGLAYRAG